SDSLYCAAANPAISQMITATPVALNKKDRKLLTGPLLEDKKSFYKPAIILCFHEICSPPKANSAAVILSEGGLPRARSSVGNPSRRIWVLRARMIMWGTRRPKKASARLNFTRTKLCCLFVCRSRSFRRQVKDNIIADEAMREVLTSGEHHILVVLSVFEV